jgi:hypothetical protein
MRRRTEEDGASSQYEFGSGSNSLFRTGAILVTGAIPPLTPTVSLVYRLQAETASVCTCYRRRPQIQKTAQKSTWSSSAYIVNLWDRREQHLVLFGVA